MSLVISFMALYKDFPRNGDVFGKNKGTKM
uniref:Uncharacterized protein n=1 Tax=Rhizophora mucronata TaxID=61149 RepID=A0A2P2Q6C3_RHIMU